MRRIVVAAVAAVAVIGALAWWFTQPSPQPGSPVVVRVGYVPVTTALPLFVAQEKGYFTEAGLEIEVARFETANQAVEAMVGNRIDATSVVADLPWLTLAQRSPGLYRLYASSVLDTEIPMDMILTLPGSGITRIEDLRDKKLATFPGSQLKSFAQAMLKKRGVDPNLVQINEMPPANQIPALTANGVDAIFCLQPVCKIAEATAGAVAVETSPISGILGDGQPISAASFGISTAFIGEHPDEAQKFVEAMWRAMADINEDQEAYRNLYASFAPVPPNLAAEIPVTKFATADGYDIGLLQREINALKESGLLEQDINLEELIYKAP